VGERRRGTLRVPENQYRFDIVDGVLRILPMKNIPAPKPQLPDPEYFNDLHEDADQNHKVRLGSLN